MRHSTIIVWFRNDLRLHDHEALYKATLHGNQIIPVYVLDPRQKEEDNFGFVRRGPFRTQFLKESLEDLDANLRKLGNKLILLEGLPEVVLPVFARQQRANAIYAHKEPTTDEIQVESHLEQQLFSLGIFLELFWGNSLYHVEDLPMPLIGLPPVFTHFRKEVEKMSWVRETFPSPSRLPSPESLPLKEIAFSELQSEETGFSKDPRSAFPFGGGESMALKRLNDYLWKSDQISTYKLTRNGLVGQAYSSKFSPWLALGCISPRYIYDQVLLYETQRVKNESTYWLVFELIWRDYFRFIARKHGADLFRRGGIKQQQGRGEVDFDLFGKWKDGLTGVPFVDANMRELKATGFMSNRGRQNVASYLVKDLNLDWRMGAAYFESMLIDYDASSNWGNWNYMAGLGNDPRPTRYFNVVAQGQRYDAQGEFIRLWVPELEALPDMFIHAPFQAPANVLLEAQVFLGENYPLPLSIPGITASPN